MVSEVSGLIGGYKFGELTLEDLARRFPGQARDGHQRAAASG
jgi:hypothetical protein